MRPKCRKRSDHLAAYEPKTKNTVCAHCGEVLRNGK